MVKYVCSHGCIVHHEYLNNGKMRISVCAVDLDNAQGVTFDSRKERITAEHIIAIGALPPGFLP